MATTLRVLLVEDTEDDALRLLRFLKRGGYEVRHERVQTAGAMRAALDRQAWDIVISDFGMPGFNGHAALALLRERDPDLPFIVVSGSIGEDTAVAMMKAGASDYVMKDNLTRLLSAVQREMGDAKVRQERRQAREALRESEAALHRAQSMAHLGHVITEADGQFESWSETLPQLVGMDPANIPRSTRAWLEMVHPEDRANFRRRCIEADIDGDRVDIEYRLQRGDGAWICIRQVIEQLRGSGGVAATGRWFNTMQDVTAQKKAEEKQRASELRYRRLFEAAKDGILILNAETGQIDDVNPFLVELLGIPRQAFVGKMLWDIGLWKDISLSKAAFKELQANDYIRYEYLPLETHDGRRIDVEFVSNAYVVDGVRVIQCNIRDITERKRAEQMRELEHGVARQLADAETGSAGLQAVMRLVCESEGWEVGRYWQADEAAGVLRFGGYWGVTDPAIERFIEQSRDVVFIPGKGLAGMVWQSGEPLWASDTSNDPRVAKTALARDAGMRGAFVFPVTSDGGTIGVIGISGRELRQPDERLLAAARVIGGQLGQFLLRKQGEGALREGEARFRSLTKLSSDWYWEQDEEFRFIKFSGGEETGMWGPDQAAQIGKRRWELPDIRPLSGTWDEHRKLLEAHESFRDFEYFRETTGTDPRYVAASGEPVFDHDGRFTGYRGTARDIGKSKQAEEEQRASRQLLDNIIENIPTAVQLKSVADDFRIVMWNKSAEKMYGVPRDAAIGHTVHDLWPQVDADRMRAADLTLIAEGGMHEFPERLAQTRDRGDISVHMRKVALVDASGKPSHLLVIADDISARLAGEARLRESEARFRNLTELSSDYYWETDAEHRILSTSHGPGHMSIVGAVARGKTRWELPSTSPDAAGWAAHRAIIDAQMPFRDFEIARIDIAGLERHILISGEPIFDPSGNFKGYQGVGKDISTRKQAEIRIRRLNRVYAVLSGINALIVRAGNRDELFREACKVAVEAGGFGIAWIGMIDLATKQFRSLAWHGIGSEHASRLVIDVAKGPSPGEPITAQAIWDKRPAVSNDIEHDPRIHLREAMLADGLHAMIVLPLLLSGEAVGTLTLAASEVGFFDDAEIKLLLELAGDISFALDHIEKSERVDYLAFYDQLTGLANRTLFLERLTQSVHAAGQGQTKLAVAILDIERMRAINESLGRQAGDAVLKTFTELLTVAAGGAKVGRIAANQFAVMLAPVKGRSEAGRLAEGLLRKCAGAPFSVEGTELRIAARAGIAQFPADGGDAETLLKHAEGALRKSKQTGERIAFYVPNRIDRTSDTLKLENKLRRALEKEEFVLHYQPKIDLETRKILGVEALIRWQSPELGMVPPMKFIPLMEETGMILEAGAWALSKAVADHSRWTGMGLMAPRVAVNVSAIQLRNRNFLKTIEEAVKRGADPTGLDIEITESLIMEDVEGTIRKLAALRSLGMSIAIDDFGTGYSSLAYLAKLPVQALKIDRSFIIGMLKDADTMTLISTMISLAHSLRLTVVAEGVELEEQAKMLRLLRCDEMQGYLFSKPLPFDALTELLKKTSGQTKQPDPVPG
ncbi:MAG: EAL domain-containing protein [Betaproteobacteria bacterium]